ncbi:hypothetical protein TCAL_05595 [Tigriopus californicus]|uniref:Octanoyl-[acyl-carrier-protein]:protein N-octanoyltransferase LIPT2, mitochondrial n=1 Tax=Tigriopus californicus TaxID=6832 RepID=A0A553NEN9_TIGCA|nr:putative lipoyltransferase 2, mitochondrial [Tigriopus californicus]TRY63914.1 hypothetical protein TCAL_05595 [Tigriopus californicus]|eukprot:TCALIF_05595-PA protein Name:"Similar to lipt2 Putative lipoyltransferase 2, mitochondrial (Danio rerio)" AED:0.01 eAED:0.01 QI:0/-1/0/1/-1/1/1/0/240
MAIPPLLRLWHLGRQRYEPVLKLQESLVSKLDSVGQNQTDSVDNILLTVEHEPVYTTGIRTLNYGPDEAKRLSALGADFVRTKRGGLITFHGPGQLVVYPIMNLRQFVPQSSARKALLGMKWYIHELEQVVIDTCAHYDLAAGRSPHTGVWIGEKKICAMGVRNSGFITSHGIALNCETDLMWFDHIVPCGIPDKGVTSLSVELQRPVTISEVAPIVIKCFQDRFDCQIAWASPETAPYF